MLLIATARMPYKYYTFARIVVCGFATFFAFVGWAEGSPSRVWSAIFGLVVVLFNPIVPFYFRRTTWFDIDVGVAIIFAAHLMFMRLSTSKMRN